MPIPQGRSGAAGHSTQLGARDPRIRRNAQSGITDDDVDGQTIELQNGTLRVKAFDGIDPIKVDGATLEDVVARLNLLTRKLQGG